MSNFVDQSLLSNIISTNVGYQAQSFYPLNAYSSPVGNGPLWLSYIKGPNTSSTAQANSDIRAMYLTSQGISNPWINDPSGAVWDENCGFWRAWMITAPNYGLSLVNYAFNVWTEVVSTDLVTWTYNQMPFHVEHNTFGSMWGGSVVIDENNTSGMGAGTVFYFVSSPGPAGFIPDSEQAISRWCAPALGYPPVLEGCILFPPQGYPREAGSGFRDSRVFWDSDRSEWICGMTIDYGLCFYTSPDLNNWTFQWVEDLRDWQQIECPNLFKMVAQDGTVKWVMMCSFKGNVNAANQAVGYLVGQWTGTKFVRDPEYPVGTMPRLYTNGPDFYAQAPFWRDYSGTECYMWGWIGNWAYSGDLPFHGYLGVQSNVTRMTLNNKNDGQGYRIFKDFMPAQTSLYAKNAAIYNYWLECLIPGSPGTMSLLSETILVPNYAVTPPTTTRYNILPQAWRLDLSFGRAKTGINPNNLPLPDTLEIVFCADINNVRYTKFGFNFNTQQWYFDRSKSGIIQPAGQNNTILPGGAGVASEQAMFNAVFSGSFTGTTADLTILVDNGYCEILINSEIYISAVIFPPDDACLANVYVNSANHASGMIIYRCVTSW